MKQETFPRLGFVIALAIVVFAACDRSPPPISGPLPQRGYVWQREWTPAVSEALGEAAARLQGVVLLGAEIRAQPAKPVVARASIDWDAMHRAKTPCALAVRVSPYFGPFSADDPVIRVVIETSASLLADAHTHGAK